ncbi:MAG: helix-turn-helix transcriptional regulator [Lachnospiraceae bacterium]|nr:helix-turn-helix transcriptional regulator [Lachnospiraceae bacterium]
MISYAPLFKTMKQKKITSYRLEKLGFSRATYYSIQKGNSVSTNTINQLCKLLKCSVSDIMEYIDEEE